MMRLQRLTKICHDQITIHGYCDYTLRGHQCRTPLFVANTISKSKMILRRLGGGDEAYNLKVTRYKYVEETNNDANKNNTLI